MLAGPVRVNVWRHLVNTCACTDGTCSAGEYRCWPDQCVSACVVCDGYVDCENDTDEDVDFCGIAAHAISRHQPNSRFYGRDIFRKIGLLP